MKNDPKIERLNERILLLERRVLEQENEIHCLRTKLSCARGEPGEVFVAELTGGERTRYKDRHDVTTPDGTRLEVKLSNLHRPGQSKTKRGTWNGLLGLNETKEFDFLVLLGEKGA